MELLGDVGGLQ